ncbi:MAG TPA: thioredoxin domain-containing protein [Terriglobales bacterium]|nr:thioredoxin domain-containing protein [Terriglobales bacterium]
MHNSILQLTKRFFALLLFLCLGCAAQSTPADVNRRIERQVRAYYNVPMDIKLSVGPRKPSEFPNYDIVVVTFDAGQHKQDREFLLSKDGRTLIRMTTFDLSKDPYAKNMEKIDVSGRPVRGNKAASVTIVNYDDFQCPYCARMHETLTNDILKTYGDRVKIVYKDFPLSEIHQWAEHAANDANCLAAQSNDAYWGFADFVHANQKTITEPRSLEVQRQLLDRITLEQGKKFNLQSAPLEACIKEQSGKALRASVLEASSLGVDATPTLFVNGFKVDGILPSAELHAIIDQALHDAGQNVGLVGGADLNSKSAAAAH